ncbi:MAG: hypothetical protein MI749_17910 [Desulfovibrionales bacterium]|nr:hypothetical protein [Desulfovibrionales bacterium]
MYRNALAGFGMLHAWERLDFIIVEQNVFAAEVAMCIVCLLAAVCSALGMYFFGSMPTTDKTVPV